jgi:hypothetical protein
MDSRVGEALASPFFEKDYLRKSFRMPHTVDRELYIIKLKT